jgi:hypothetical protein
MCTCHTLWNSILPPPPCPVHTIAITGPQMAGQLVVYNGLCECRGPLAPHPFHVNSLPPEYVGKHREPGA